MFGVLGLIGSGLSLLTGLAPAIGSYLSTKKNDEAAKFAAMSAAERDEYVAHVKAISDLNSAKVSHGRTTAAQIMVYVFGVPPAIHWAGVYLTATFPQFGLHVDPLHGYYATAEEQIALSFFLLAPSLPIVGALTTRLRA